MPIESATYLSQLDAANPTSADPKSEGDNHLCLIKAALKATFPSFGAYALNATQAQIDGVALTFTVSGGLVGLGNPTPDFKFSLNNGDICVRNGTLLISNQIGTPLGRVSAFNNDSVTGGLVFSTKKADVWAEASRIDADGRHLFGYTSSNGDYKIQVNGQIFATSSTIATSDAKYKTNVQPITGATELVKRLRPVTFEWLTHKVHKFPEGVQVGWLAQDVAEATQGREFATTLVKSNKLTFKDKTTEDFLGVSEAGMVPILMAAVQELIERVEALEAARA